MRTTTTLPRDKNKSIRNARPRSDYKPQTELQWYRRMKIWHALKNNPQGLTTGDLMKITGYAPATVHADLEVMGGVRYEPKAKGRTWFAV